MYFIIFSNVFFPQNARCPQSEPIAERLAKQRPSLSHWIWSPPGKNCGKVCKNDQKMQKEGSVKKIGKPNSMVLTLVFSFLNHIWSRCRKVVPNFRRCFRLVTFGPLSGFGRQLFFSNVFFLFTTNLRFYSKLCYFQQQKNR